MLKTILNRRQPRQKMFNNRLLKSPLLEKIKKISDRSPEHIEEKVHKKER